MTPNWSCTIKSGGLFPDVCTASSMSNLSRCWHPSGRIERGNRGRGGDCGARSQSFEPWSLFEHEADGPRDMLPAGAEQIYVVAWQYVHHARSGKQDVPGHVS